ncbi:hypothetical protein [Methylobacterium sp. D54C]
MLYNPPSGSTDPNAPYVGKDTAAGRQGSKLPPAAAEFPQRELVNAVTASGQTPTNGNLVQLAVAIARGIFVGGLTGTGDLAVATLGVVFPALVQGMRIAGVATAANTVTAPKLRVMNLGAAGAYQDFPIVKENGAALAVGDIVPGRRYRFEYDGAGNMAISGGGLDSGGALNVINNLKIPGGRLYVYDTAGSGTLAVPAGTTFRVEECRGAGGGGGGATSTATAGSGGGQGGLVSGLTATATVDTVLAYTVGAGGSGGGDPGGTGGTTSIVVQSGSVTDASGTVYAAGTTLCACAGGGGGRAGTGTTPASTGGSGGVASGPAGLARNGDAGGTPINTTGGGTASFVAGAGGGGSQAPQGSGGFAVGDAGAGGSGASANATGGTGKTGRIKIYSK